MAPKTKTYNITLIANTSQTTRALLRTSLPSPDEDIYWALLGSAKNKLKLPNKKKPSRLFFSGGDEIDEDTSDKSALTKFDSLEANGTEIKLFVSGGEDYAGPKASVDGAKKREAAPSRVIAKQAQVDPEALQELETTAKLEGMELAVGMPDLHPGGRFPVGATFLTSSVIYPPLIGSDIGCGMRLQTVPIAANSPSAKPKKLASALVGLEGNFKWKDEPEGAEDAFWERFGISDTAEAGFKGRWGNTLGTVGAGNHFLEILRWEEVVDQDLFDGAGLDKENLVMLVHSGSRGLGQHVLSQVNGDRLTAPSTTPPSEKPASKTSTTSSASDATASYLKDHDSALKFAQANRALLAHRALRALSLAEEGDVAAESKEILDIAHNWIERKEVDRAVWERMTGKKSEGDDSDKKVVWVHRKGAAPSDRGLVIIPGSRGHPSYLVMPTGSGEHNAWSLAHGAGRQLSRTDSYAKFSQPERPSRGNPSENPSGAKENKTMTNRRRQTSSAPDTESFRHLANTAIDPEAMEDLTGFGGSGGSAGKKTRNHLNSDALRHLTTTTLGSEVICEDLTMLFEEAPEAYKDIQGVVKDLESVGACKVVAVMKPLVTYKKRREWAAK